MISSIHNFTIPSNNWCIGVSINLSNVTIILNIPLFLILSNCLPTDDTTHIVMLWLILCNPIALSLSFVTGQSLYPNYIVLHIICHWIRTSHLGTKDDYGVKLSWICELISCPKSQHLLHTASIILFRPVSFVNISNSCL